MAFRIAFKSGRGKNNWKHYLMKLLIMNNCLMLDSWNGKMNKHADSLNCTGQLWNVMEFNCDFYLTDWLIFTSTVRDWSFTNVVRSHRIHSEASTLGGIWWWYPHVRCHPKCLCMYFTDMFVRNSDLKMISSSLYTHCTEAHHKSLCWDIQNSTWTSYCWRMPDFISTLGIYTWHISLLGAQREFQSTRLCYFILF